MTRFSYRKDRKRSRIILMPFLLSLLILILVFFTLSALSKGNIDRQMENLTFALNQDITYCYAAEGAYPESLDYLKEHYGLTYNEDLFFVDYQVAGRNIRPDVTILRKGDK